MVKETRHIIDLSDIKAIRIQCGHCDRETVHPPDRAKVPGRCPICEEEFLIDAKEDRPFTAAQAFTKALGTLIRQSDPMVKVRIETGCEGEHGES